MSVCRTLISADEEDGVKITNVPPSGFYKVLLNQPPLTSTNSSFWFFFSPLHTLNLLMQ